MSAKGALPFKPDWDNYDEEYSESALLDEPDLDDDEEHFKKPLDVELNWDGELWEDSGAPKFGFITLDSIGRQRVRVKSDGTVFVSDLRRLGIGELARGSRSKAGQQRYAKKLVERQKMKRERTNKYKMALLEEVRQEKNLAKKQRRKAIMELKHLL